jgi:hypothetical protein
MNLLAWTVLAMMTVGHAAGPTDDLVRQALDRFPSSTANLEFCNVSKMRPLPAYAALRQRFLGAEMQQLVASLETLGVRDEDVDRLALGAGPVADRPGLELYGIAEGRFKPSDITARARAAGMDPLVVNGYPVYCFGGDAAARCFAILDPARGVFGSRDMIDYMLYADAGTDSLAKVPLVTARVAHPPADASVWGIATGPAVAEWVNVVMPMPAEGQNSLAPVLASVVSISYEVRAGQNVALSADLACTNAESAARLRQSLDAARALQQFAWRTMRPDVPNPYERLAFSAQGSQLQFRATMDYDALGLKR